MKRNKRLALLLSAIALTSISVSTLAIAQPSSHAQQTTRPDGGTIDMSNDDHSTQRITLPNGGTIDITTLSLEAARQAETNRQLQEAGIELAPEQEAQLRQAFSEAIASTLSAEQQQVWEQYLSDRTAQQAQANRGEMPLQRDRAAEAREREAIKQALRTAGVPLTPEQEAQMQQLDEQMGNQLEQAFRTNPLQSFGQLFSLFFLPQPIAERMFGASSVGNSLQTYMQATNTILTPKQQQVWERYWSERQGTQNS